MALRITEEEFASLMRRGSGTWEAGINPNVSRPSKYGNAKAVIDGIRFDSKAEAARYAELKTMQQCGHITDLVLQKEFLVAVNGHHICKYIADFAYMEDGMLVVEDVKGVRTPAYRLKKKLVEAIYGIEIKEVKVK